MLRFIFLVLILLFGCIANTPIENETTQTNQHQSSCTETDGGFNVLARGSTTANGTVVDSCNNNLLNEYFCNNGTIVSEIVTCPNGTVCSDGACKPNVIQNNKTVDEFCTDNDDGIDIYVPGTVTYKNETYQDACHSANSVLEYFCSDGNVFYTVVDCGLGNSCQGNICLNASRTCTETDADDEYELGKIIQYSNNITIQSKYDSCIDNNTIREYYCNLGEINSKTLECQENEVCSGGTCINICEDGDSGIDTDVPSYVRDQNEVYSDYCHNETTIVEYGCSNGSVMTYQSECEVMCKNGRCYNEEDVTCEQKNSGITVKLISGTTTLDTAGDFCIDYETRMDYSCSGSLIESDEAECRSNEFCYAGKCYEITSEACYDIDSGAQYNGTRTASYIILTNSDSIDDVRYDYCVSTTMVAEYSCSSTKTAIDFYDCVKNAECIDGACVYPYTCVDSHNSSSSFGSVSLYENGTAEITEYDTCASQIVTRRVGCTTDGTIYYTLVECPNGTSCDNGSCD